MKTLFSVLSVLLSLSASAQWQSINTPRISQAIIHTFSPDTFHMAGYNGNFYHSETGGATYTKDSLNLFGGWLLDMEFANANIGYACGGTAFGNFASPIVKTLDGGSNWDTLITNAYGNELRCLHVVNNQTVYFGGNGFVVKTTDGGASFSVDTVGNGIIFDLHFFNVNEGVVAMNNQVLRTTDAGLTWNAVLTDTTNQNTWNSGLLSFPEGATKGFYINRGGYLYTSDNNGQNWTYTSRADTSFWVNDVDFVSESVGFAVTSDPLFFNVRGNILGTNDGGLSWTSLARSDSGAFTGISMANGKSGYAVTNSKVYKTSNGGALNLPVFSPTQEIEVYPNPVEGVLRLGIGKNKLKTIELYSESGEKVKSFNPLLGSLQMHELTPGVYFLKLELKDGGSQVKKIWVKN